MTAILVAVLAFLVSVSFNLTYHVPAATVVLPSLHAFHEATLALEAYSITVVVPAILSTPSLNPVGALWVAFSVATVSVISVVALGVPDTVICV